MDRLYILQKTYISPDRKNPDAVDGVCVHNILAAKAAQNLDYVVVADDPAQAARYASSFPGMLPIPVGTLDFVRQALGNITGNRHFTLAPCEVPLCLQRFTGRTYDIVRGKDILKEVIQDGTRWFIKDASELKYWNNLLYDGDCMRFIHPDREYVVSERVVFESEYRTFIFRGEILAVQHYLGNPLVFPSADTLNEIVVAYQANHHPESYTLDVGILRSGKTPGVTVIIEVHPFVSCGLYGFCGNELPDMFEDGIKWYLQQNP